MNPLHFNRVCLPSLLTDDPSPNDEPELQYYMNEGVYGSFASKLSETLIAAPSAHKVSLKDSLWVNMWPEQNFFFYASQYLYTCVFFYWIHIYCHHILISG